MRHCPTCGSSYTDDTLVYCLQDGATLQSQRNQTNPLSMVATLHDETPTHDSANDAINVSSAPTVQIPASALPTALYQEARPTVRSANEVAVSSPTTRASNPARVIITTVVITILLLGLGGVGAWMLFRGGGGGRVGQRRAAEGNSNSALPADSTGASNTSNATNTTGTDNQTQGNNRPDRGGRWFVILGSFPKDDLNRANERLAVVRQQGFDARIVSSDDYPNLKSGLWVLVMGPYTRNRAEEFLERVRPKVRDAYTKSGW
jgi:hypothetical protein